MRGGAVRAGCGRAALCCAVLTLLSALCPQGTFSLIIQAWHAPANYLPQGERRAPVPKRLRAARPRRPRL